MKQIPGMFKGLGVTAKTMLRTLFPDGLRKPIPQPTKGAHTVQYPHEKETPAPRARGVIALHTENCTLLACCAPENAPTGASTLKGTKPWPRLAGKAASLASATFWIALTLTTPFACIAASAWRSARLTRSSGPRRFEYSEPRIADLLHDKERLSDWMETVPEFEDYEGGSEQKKRAVPKPVDRTNPMAATPAAELGEQA